MATAVRTPSEKMIDRALAKSEEQVLMGNLPRLLREDGEVTVWSVGSRTSGGTVYTIELRPGSITCDCPAERTCWHRMHVLRAWDGEIPFYRSRPSLVRPAPDDDGWQDDGAPPPPRDPQPGSSGRGRASGWYAPGQPASRHTTAGDDVVLPRTGPVYVTRQEVAPTSRPPDTLTVTEAAAFLGVYRSAIQQAIARGSLKAARYGHGQSAPYLIRRIDLEAFAAGRPQPDQPGPMLARSA